MYTWSQYSIDLFNAVADTTDNIQVNACPGAGKTTNCKEIWQRSSDDSIAYLVFNKANADEAKGKLPDKGQKSYVGTMHSLGLRAINAVLGKDHRAKVDTNGNKVRRFVWDNYPFYNDRLKQLKQQDIIKLVSLLKGTGCCSIDTCKALIDTHELLSFPELIPIAQNVYEWSLSHVEMIDFDDMLLLPAVNERFKAALPQYNLVLGDEGQDFNQVQLKLLGNIARRLVVVGDEHQAIYGFRGALNDSLAQVRDQYQAIRMPLNLTYRCPQTVVTAAQHYYPDDIECLPTAEQGVVRTVEAADRLTEDYRAIQDSLVVCRNMAPLVQFAYLLLRHRIPVRLRGRDIGQSLVKFIRHFDCIAINDMLSRLDDWRMEQEDIARQEHNDNKLQTIADKYETVQVFASMCDGSTCDNLTDLITSLFERDYGIELSTIHRAKGLEALRVYWLNPELVPSKYAKQAWQLTQENNLAYVAVTRAKHELVYLPG